MGKKKEDLEKETVKLRTMLANYLREHERSPLNYRVYQELLKLLQAIDFNNMKMKEVDFGPVLICPEIKLDTKKGMTIAMTIVYTYINCHINASLVRKNFQILLVTLPEEVQLQLDKFRNQLDRFLFS